MFIYAVFTGHLPGLPTEATKTKYTVFVLREVTQNLERGPDLIIQSVEKTLISNASAMDYKKSTNLS